MKQERNALKAGIFILISLVLIFGIAVSITGLSGFQPAQTLTVSFTLADDLGGLRVGDDVRIGGFKVGVVRDIEVVPREQVMIAESPSTQPTTLAAALEPELLRVTFTMPKRYTIRQGATIGIQGTVTGQSWVNFSSLGPKNQPPIDNALALVGQPSPFNALLTSLGGAAPELQDILQQVNKQTVPAATHLLVSARTDTLGKVNQTVDTLRTETLANATGVMTDVRSETIPRVNRILDDVRAETLPRANKMADSGTTMMTHIGDVFGEGKGDLKSTFANLNASTASIKTKLPGILDQVTGAMAKIDSALVSANEALTDVKKTVENTRDATGTVKNVLGNNKSKLDGIITSVKATSDNLQGASAEIRRSPWRLLYKPNKGEMANLNIFDSARSFAEGANDLNDAAQALRDALKSGEQDPKAIQALMDRVEKSFNNFSAVEKTLWEQVRE